jgi:UDP-3-O-[3-hydroxymyristoyl] glucosamine N-acyltransferase
MISNDVKFIGKYKIGHYVIIESGVTVEDGVEIGDFVVIRKDSTIKSGAKIESFVEIQSGVTIGCNSTIGSHSVVKSSLIIGDSCKIKELTSITHNIEEFTEWIGNPAVYIRHLRPIEIKERPKSNK